MASSKKTSEFVVKTGLASELELLSRIPIQFTPKTETTINRKYNWCHDIVPPTVPRLQYFGLGIRGFKNADDGILANPHQPINTELDLYEPIPIRCVPIDEDLSSAERANYRMRIRKNIKGTWYYCYYLKKLQVLDSKIQVTQTNPLTGAQEPYEYTQADLNPVPRDPATSGEQAGSAVKVNVGVHLGLSWTGAEVLEYINAMYEGDMRYAKISEVGLYSGTDATVNGTDSANVEFQYTESIYTQLNYKITNIGSAITSPSYDGSREFLLGNGDLLLLSK